jgi:hypothetical protein
MSDHERAAQARDYLAELLEVAEIEHWGDLEEWGEGLVAWLSTLPAEHPYCQTLGTVLGPFIDDDERLTGVLYADGATSWYLDNGPRGGDYETNYVPQLLNALIADHDRWLAHIEETGDAARWDETPPALLNEDEQP